MGDCSTEVPGLGGGKNLIAAANEILNALGSKKNLTNDEKRILADLGSQLSTIDAACEEEEIVDASNIELRLNAIHEKIMSWEEDQSMIWDSGLEEANQYLNAADEARKLTEKLDGLGLNKGEEEKELLRRADDLLQIAIARLEEEFKYILVQNRQPFEPEHVSFRSNEPVSFLSSEAETEEMCSMISVGDESFDESLRRDSGSRTSGEFIVDLVNPDVISDLKCIANLMFISGYGNECSQAYINVRRDALDECLFILEIEKLSIEDVLKLEWGSLNSKIKRWVRAMKIFVRVYLASEKWLADQIFEELGMVNVNCFAEASKASMFQLLNFGEAISIGPHEPAKLFPILDMYEVVADLLPEIDSLYSDEAGSGVRNDCRELQSTLADSVRAAFLEFEKAIATSTSTTPFANGGIHHLTRYVMNYVNTLTDYQETLNLLLKDKEGREQVLSSPDMSPASEEENNSGRTQDVSPMSQHFHSVASILECNLDDKSKLYRDPSLQHIFMMNNIHYMAQKVKKSELRPIFGDDWIRKRNWKFQQHAIYYERATWSSILALLKDEGNSVSKTHLKERFRSFYLSFEEVYRTQTAWLIPDDQLREDLRISTSLKVIQAYRTFVGRHSNHISDNYIKYSADDLEAYILDLFGGSPKSLHNPHRR